MFFRGWSPSENGGLNLYEIAVLKKPADSFQDVAADRQEGSFGGENVTLSSHCYDLTRST